jgi:hypothetical protein
MLVSCFINSISHGRRAASVAVTAACDLGRLGGYSGAGCSASVEERSHEDLRGGLRAYLREPQCLRELYMLRCMSLQHEVLNRRESN